MDSKDDRQPYTDSYSFTISQRLPWSSLLEVAYVGNQSKDLQITGGAGSNINLVPVGAMLSSRNGGVDPNSLTADNFRPLKGFSDLRLATNRAYANYNALQVTWVRTKGRYTINMNYTFGKAMGIVNSGIPANPNLDQFNLANNYGVQPANRKQIFNAAYSIELGNPVQDKIAGGFLNGWQLSGITQMQSGANLTGFSINNANFGMNLNGAKIPGTQFNISNVSLLGTNDIQLSPMLTCNPAVGLGNESVHQPELFRHPERHRPEWPDRAPGDLRTGFLQLRSGTFQELPVQGVEEAAAPAQCHQLPEPPAVVVQRKQPDSRFRSEHRQSQHAAVRHRNSEAGPPHRPGGDQVLLLIAVRKRQAGRPVVYGRASH